jgi:hypothetical protein
MKYSRVTRVIARASVVAACSLAACGNDSSSRQRALSAGECENVQCLRPIDCVATCGGAVLSSGCCPCGDGLLDPQLACDESAGVGGGSSGSGGAYADCEKVQCLRAIECVESCAGPVLNRGCCACKAGTFDRVLECVAGTGGVAGRDASVDPGGAGSSGTAGAANAGGSAHAGSGGDCTTGLCVRPIDCVAFCGGPVLSSGCCPCAHGTFDRALSCK